MIETHTATPKKEMRGSLELVGKIVTSCSESKGSDVVVLELDPSGSVADYFIIVSGRSDRQVQGISNRIVEDLSQSGVKPYAVEGMEQGHWVILDFGDAIVHVFYGPDRERYDLEGLWTRAGRYVIEESAGGVKLKAA